MPSARLPGGSAERALLILVLVPFLLGAAAAPSEDEHVVFAFKDKQITESSGLVALPDGLFVTTNDSGDDARVFTVDDHGRTVGVTTWADDATDVEALAPASADEVWVGDTGDNRSSRDSVQVARVPVGRGDRTSHAPVYDLTYPDGAHDAETLLAGPDGRLYLVTKGFLGGTVYAAPTHLDPDADNRLVRLGTAGAILPMATDGTFLPDGGHVLIRGYGSAAVYDFPSLDRVTGFGLPAQPQGEGLAVAADGTLYTSSEGIFSKVLRLPQSGRCSADAGICALDRAATAQPPPTPPAEPHVAPRTDRQWWPWLLVGGVGVAVIWLQARLLRRR
ncbi:hypothetical protein SAMN04487968_108180 [Nocardioides terrae]|uniref:WD40 repeat domain-containing protein n=1 Tax=Nocardioides terrae TaxID=574651 RepID=A0A1I1KJU0_9ACTN|nr:hypothetical protein [Nocardioides terrae]SFC60835.1 hypothetical protein SAMN04487968_108180 [Nocardioides terrae]